MSETDPKTLLHRLWRDWDTDPGSAEEQHAALELLQGWLAEPAHQVRGVQILLADPESSGVGGRKIVHDVAEVLDEAWGRAGVGPTGVLQLQALLIAAWPAPSSPIPGYLSTPWRFVQGRPRQEKAIAAWRSQHESPGAGSRRKTLNLGKGFNLPRDFIQQKITPLGVNAIGAVEPNKKHLVPPLTDLAKASLSLQSNIAHLQLSASGAFEELAAQLELLWWGQARYCHLRSAPYRDLLGSSEEVFWCACREVVERSRGLPCEPVASYLVECLARLELDVMEQRTLSDWTQSLRDVAANCATGDRGTLQNLASDDPLGLPITNAILGEAGHGLDMVQLPGSVQLTRAEWAMWVLRELLLDRSLGDQ